MKQMQFITVYSTTLAPAQNDGKMISHVLERLQKRSGHEAG
jgi:hypothetical protein